MQLLLYSRSRGGSTFRLQFRCLIVESLDAVRGCCCRYRDDWRGVRQRLRHWLRQRMRRRAPVMTSSAVTSSPRLPLRRVSRWRPVSYVRDRAMELTNDVLLYRRHRRAVIIVVTWYIVRWILDS